MDAPTGRKVLRTEGSAADFMKAKDIVVKYGQKFIEMGTAGLPIDTEGAFIEFLELDYREDGDYDVTANCYVVMNAFFETLLHFA